jgi:uncharacterized protein (TIGR00288 family)
VEEKLNFAVFIDYDNIEIGVKSTLHREFDVDVVLEGIKERGEIAAKVAYGNWMRQGQATRAFTEHGVQMVQRDSTPRGDKNGADINLALDALEMAFTREHINAFAIISGDSDFMALVNKLKQFNKRVYIVGGKGFTSTILQRNCHEFISYESLLDSITTVSRRGGRQAPRPRARRSLPLSQALPLIDRALGALELRGVLPQLGLLKSTMLQLDPAFSERDYGESSFSAFVEKLVKGGMLSLRTVDGHSVVDRHGESEEREEESSAVSGEDALPFLQEVLQSNVDLLAMGIPAREIRALTTVADPEFKESDYGFQEFTELLNFAADKGLIRVESDPNRGLRFYPGEDLQQVLAKPSPKARSSASAKPAAGRPESEEAERTEAGAIRSRGRRRRGRRNGSSAPPPAGPPVSKPPVTAAGPAEPKAERAAEPEKPAVAASAKADAPEAAAEAAEAAEAKPKRARRKTTRRASPRSRKTAEKPSEGDSAPEESD